jgi:hypothetical protein
MTAKILMFPISGDAIARMQSRQRALTNYLQSVDWAIEQELNSAYRDACRLESRSKKLLDFRVDAVDAFGELIESEAQEFSKEAWDKLTRDLLGLDPKGAA